MPATESTPSLSGRPLSSRIGYGLVKAALRVRQSYAEALSRVGLLPNHHAILSTLDELGPCHQKELASRVVVDPGDIVAYLDSLQESGYVVRERDQSDRRRQVVSITDSGVAKLIEGDAALDAVEQEVFESLTDRERETLTVVSAKLTGPTARPSEA
ncbi:MULTISPECIES: MarR family winged helix-turn-helix transcriptional regulator [Rhodococcus]|jgi:MarR family transcriptional regulator, lower aerobic nicotinate degradation pathway regulator|uniref:MarR family winged helix-turn-helix transcriptional regulator n=1 Tax=Rhodococcus TaxID=1827 RepID=UPI0006BA6828|nr:MULTISPECIES: MarR family transcriptional regulator [Rhodococcus]MBP1050649.1 MarR family transcriptional regulator [Rhodococcus qingshengii]MCT6732710.1 MarR family transcriptional regulator [Rhodococcus qingshengii]MDJ0432691.1 MarR family transcriptional regulator [Rhodococcus qingshengii]UGQ51352.1 MarR family transcriptional regulator [Rhodococcus qingshengii]